MRANSDFQRDTSALALWTPASLSADFASAVATPAAATSTSASACFFAACASKIIARLSLESASISGTKRVAKVWPFLTLSPMSTFTV